MGRLLNPGLGELVDRLTILKLKIAHAGQQPGTGAYDHFAAEEAQVNMLLDRMGHPKDDAVLTLQVKLLQQNAKLWELEDLMAGDAKTDWFGGVPADILAEIAQRGMDIWKANQERNRLIHEINVLAGTSYGPEKL